MINEEHIIALLIDTENVSPKYMDYVEKELISIGRISYKRMYGDFTSQGSSGWRQIVNEHSITPIQQYTYKTGKNVTDSRMIIDAMDILYTGNVNAMCIMSSDSDFTGLSRRLKESNIYVIGAGENKTPASFINSCDRFIILDKKDESEEREEPIEESKKETSKGKSKVKEKENEVKIVDKKEIESFISDMLNNTSGAIQVSQVVEKIRQKYPQFNVKNYGYKKTLDFFDTVKYKITCPIENTYFIEMK